MPKLLALPFLASLAVQHSLLLLTKKCPPHEFPHWKHSWNFPTLRPKIYAYIISVSASTLWPRSIFPLEQELRTARLKKAFLEFSTFRTQYIHISCLLLPAHSSYDRLIFPFEQELRVARLLRKHFWSFPHLERSIYTYLVCFCQRTLATIDIPFLARITNHTRFIEKHLWCLSTFRTKNTHILSASASAP